MLVASKTIGFTTLGIVFLGAALAARAQSPASPPSFEVASIRPTPPASLGYTTFGPSGENRYTASNVSLSFLVQVAYGVPYEQITGIDKLGSEHYEVGAKAEDGVLLTIEQLQPRMRRLLAERFKLATHTEMKDFDGYALVAAKGGPNLKPATGGSESVGTIYPGGLRLLNMPLSTFASTLRSTARPVVDKTGIAGNYDFTLTYARENDTDSPLPSFFTALQETFGLRLEATKIPLELVVIDRVEKIPAEN